MKEKIDWGVWKSYLKDWCLEFEERSNSICRSVLKPIKKIRVIQIMCASNTAFVKIRGFNPPILQQTLMVLTIDTVFIILR